MKVIEVKKKIADLKSNYDNMVNLQEYFLGHTSAEDYKEIQKKLEDDASLDCNLRSLCSVVAKTLREEIERLEKAIDNADIRL